MRPLLVRRYRAGERPGSGVAARILYKDDDEWKPVETQDAFAVGKDEFNIVRFSAVTTTALRVELQAQSNFSVGMQKWTVK